VNRIIIEHQGQNKPLGYNSLFQVELGHKPSTCEKMAVRSGFPGGSAAYFTVSSLRRCAVAHFGSALQCTVRYGTLVATQARKPP